MHKFNMKQQKGVMRKKEGKRYEVREAVKDCIGLCAVVSPRGGLHGFHEVAQLFGVEFQGLAQA